MFRTRILYHYGSSHFDTGSPRALYELIRLVQGMPEYDPIYFTSAPGPLPSAIEDLGVEVKGLYTTSSVTPRAPVTGLRRCWRWRERLKAWRVGLVHLNEVGWNTDILFGAAFARIPTIIHAHNPTIVYPRNMNRLVAKTLLVPSDAMTREIKGIELIKGGVRVVPNVVDLRRFEKGRDIRGHLPVREDEFFVLFVGQIRHGKGVDVLIDVAQRLRDVGSRAKFLLAGPEAIGESGYSRKIRSMISRAGLGERVLLLGTRDDIPDLMATADVFFLPTRGESFGLVFLEAMAAGLPVIGSEVGAVPEIVGNGGCGWLFNPEDSLGFANALRALEADSQRRREMGRNGQERANALFGADAVKARIREVYKEVVVRPGSTRGCHVCS